LPATRWHPLGDGSTACSLDAEIELTSVCGVLNGVAREILRRYRRQRFSLTSDYQGEHTSKFKSIG
jgi:hypothetical protein